MKFMIRLMFGQLPIKDEKFDYEFYNYLIRTDDFNQEDGDVVVDVQFDQEGEGDEVAPIP